MGPQAAAVLAAFEAFEFVRPPGAVGFSRVEWSVPPGDGTVRKEDASSTTILVEYRDAEPVVQENGDMLYAGHKGTITIAGYVTALQAVRGLHEFGKRHGVGTGITTTTLGPLLGMDALVGAMEGLT